MELGYLKGIKQVVPSFTGKKMLLIGAGGAARAIYFTMAQAGVKNIDVANRTLSQAEIFSGELSIS